MKEIEIKRDLSPKGQKNIIEKLLNKLAAASFRLECRSRTIINIDDYDETIIYWALQEYYKKLKESEADQEVKNDNI